jgi:uncharacterized protein
LTIETILWQGFFLPGHEICRLSSLDSGWQLDGAAVFSHDQQPCWVEYRILTDPGWQTVSAQIHGWLGNSEVDIQLACDEAKAWSLNGLACPEVAGCLDVDLNFSPSTNLLPIRRLALTVGQTASIQVAWLRFPSFTLEALAQKYTRLDESTYHYESAGGQFIADLQVNSSGFVTDYPDLWRAVAVKTG